MKKLHTASHKIQEHTCCPGTVVATRVLSVSENLQGWVSAHTIFAAHVGIGSTVHLDHVREEH